MRVVDRLEKNGAGLNLTYEVKNGIATHSASDQEMKAVTLEGRAVRIADKVAYVNHDIEDAVRAGVLEEKDLPWEAIYVLGRTKSQRLTTIISSVIENRTVYIRMAP